MDILVILGDLKHSILRPPPNERFLVTSLLTYLSGKGVEVHLLRGNHDSRIEKMIPNLENIHLSEEAWMRINLQGSGSALITHGHRRVPSQIISPSDIIILGHLHPCLKITGRMGETMILRVFLEVKARYTGDGVKRIVILPAFNPLCCYLFDPYELKKRLVVLRDFAYEPEEIDVFDLARNYLKGLVKP